MLLKSKTFALGVSLACMVTLSACSGRSEAEKVVRNSLKDPDSAKFGTFYSNSKTGKACLITNAKNAMGGYTGDKQVRLKKDDNGWQYMSEEEESESACREYYADKDDSATPTLTAEQLENESNRLNAEADNVVQN